MLTVENYAQIIRREILMVDISDEKQRNNIGKDNTQQLFYKCSYTSWADCAPNAKNSFIIMDFLAVMAWNEGDTA